VPRKNIAIIEISDHSNIGSDYQYFYLIIRLTLSIIDYRTALVPGDKIGISLFGSGVGFHVIIVYHTPTQIRLIPNSPRVDTCSPALIMVFSIMYLFISQQKKRRRIKLHLLTNEINLFFSQPCALADC
jgi:hypothetical protein